ncbi:MAG: hypothetical protein KUG79_13885 [Pseudomonadales bacterium]|nr:hypothetical protein [Pseudomonadales bacterium]
MMDLPLSGGINASLNADPATRRPGMQVSFAAVNSAAGGLADVAANVAAAVGLGPGSTIDPWQRSLMHITSQSFLAPRVDQATITLADDGQSPPVNVGDSGELQLGYEDDQLYAVFKGNIIGIKRGIDGKATVKVGNAAHTLSQQRINQSFEQLSAGEIIKTLAGSVDVETDTVESGIDLPFYVLDDGRSLYQHIALLAEKSGYIAFVNQANKLNFMPMVAAGITKSFTYGVDLIQVRVVNTATRIDSVTMVGAGAAGSQGAETWSWLVKDPQSISATAGDLSDANSKSRLVSDPVLRSVDAVQQAAVGKLLFANQQCTKAKLTVVGAADVNAGSRIEIAAAPQVACNGAAIVESAQHHYSKLQGFITELVVMMETAGSLDSLSAAGAKAGLAGLL